MNKLLPRALAYIATITVGVLFALMFNGMFLVLHTFIGGMPIETLGAANATQFARIGYPITQQVVAFGTVYIEGSWPIYASVIGWPALFTWILSRALPR